MKKRKNRRTLKKRIKRVISLSTFITVIFLSGVMILLILFLSREFASYQAEVVSNSIQQEITAGNAVNPSGISGVGAGIGKINGFGGNNPKIRIWPEDLNSADNKVNYIDKNDPRVKIWLEDLNRRGRISGFLPFTSDINTYFIKIEINNELLFSNEDMENEELLKFYKETLSVKPILDSNNKVIGNVAVRVNPLFLLQIVVPLITFIVFLSLLALIISKILSWLLVIPLIQPLKQLETKIKAIAEGDQETAVNTQIILKKPLREIESLADSTNSITKKLKGYNELLESQKEALKNQNAELEAQNEELVESRMEIQKHQAKLVQSEKMASVGMLTAAITHEINTPIGAINSNAQIEDMLLKELINHPKIQSDNELDLLLDQLKEVNDVNLMACSRIMEIIRSLKSFSRLDQAEFQEANINEGIKSVLVLVNNLLKKRITVHEDFGDIPMVKCFPSQLNQVFMNIIVNASQAIEGEGDIFIRTYQQDRYICISIRDTGTGIKEENIPKIFDPGFTSKGVGIGLGLGLYISYNIIQNHRGEISVASEYGKGAEFTIKIPLDNDRT